MPAFLPLLCLVLAANGGPVLTRLLLKDRFAHAIDGGRLLVDQRPVFGPSKTWAGLISAAVFTGALAAPLGVSPILGLSIGLAAMAGDLLSSFIKRRLGLASSRPAPGLDQLPESLFPALLAAGPMGLAGLDILLTVMLFIMIEIASSHLLYRLGLRTYPY
jgi:hypothetical protein